MTTMEAIEEKVRKGLVYKITGKYQFLNSEAAQIRRDISDDKNQFKKIVRFVTPTSFLLAEAGYEQEQQCQR